MRNNIVGAAAVAIALLASSAASAADFSVYYLGDLTQGQAAFIKSFANAKSVQASINGDPAVAAGLRAQGVQIKNVILSRPAFDGSTIYYVK